MTIWKRLYHRTECNLDIINDKAKTDPIALIGKCEGHFKNCVSVVTEYVLSSENKIKFIMLSGPSSSGKTALANMIKNDLCEKGIASSIMSLDNFYFGYKRIPLWPDGSHNFESIDGLDIVAVKNALNNIQKNGFCNVPLYNFSAMSPSKTKIKILLDKSLESILIVEGLHALNPVLTDTLNKSEVLKVYTDALGEISGDTGAILKNTEIRLMRRLLRDFNYRNALPTRTLLMWKNVCLGEQMYVRKFEPTSDISINSFHAYEPCVMAHRAFELLNSVPQEMNLTPWFSDFIYNLKKFERISTSLVPLDSLLREFI